MERPETIPRKECPADDPFPRYALALIGHSLNKFECPAVQRTKVTLGRKARKGRAEEAREESEEQRKRCGLRAGTDEHRTATG